MHLWLLAAVNPALRLPPTTHLSPVMRADDLPRVEQGRPTGDRFSGGSVPFAGDQVNPASARAANRAARASRQSSSEPNGEFWTMYAESDGPNPTRTPPLGPRPSRQQRNADAPPPVESGRATGDRFSGGSLPFAPIGTAGGGSSATGSALPRQRARDDFELGARATHRRPSSRACRGATSTAAARCPSRRSARPAARATNWRP